MDIFYMLLIINGAFFESVSGGVLGIFLSLIHQFENGEHVMCFV